ncbi:MAG: transposase [Nostoc sp. ChiQUE01b]|nr:transposase [Nostoc sp. ChiQUE01b]MDZ8257994.1 transposase [Nostoc sp. ChiQUE01b]
MQKWAESELQAADLGDARRNKRLVRIVEDLASQPASSVPQACGDIAATSAVYDFWNSPYFQRSDIRNAHIKSTIKRIKEHQVI